METAILNRKPSNLQIIAEGRVAKIDLQIEEICMVEMQPHANGEETNSPVMIQFFGCLKNSSYYLRVFDHRQASREAFQEGGEKALIEVFNQTPCLARFAVKRCQYLAIVDIGTDDVHDGGTKEQLVITTTDQFRHSTHRVMRNGDLVALHLATGICLVEPRPAKPKPLRSEAN